MSELDNAIKRLKENTDNKELPYIIADIIKKNCSKEVIDLILQNLKECDNANLNEALDCSLKLYKMVESAGNDKGFNLNEAWEYHNTIKHSLLKAIKQEDKVKAFDLINEKDIDIKLLKWAYPSVDAYNQKVREQKDYWWRKELTKEEFEFIGRMVGAK